jgi:hypothetical protein
MVRAPEQVYQISRDMRLRRGEPKNTKRLLLPLAVLGEARQGTVSAVHPMIERGLQLGVATMISGGQLDTALTVSASDYG